MSANGDSLAAALRRFNRLYTPLLGTLDKGYLDTPHSVQEARVLYEVAHAPGSTARDIQARTGFDQGYLSRIIARLTRQGLIARSVKTEDRRAHALTLTPAGTDAFRVLNARADAQANTILDRVPASSRARLRDALRALEETLCAPEAKPPQVAIRDERIGDLGWVFQHQPALYAAEHGFSQVFETYFAAGLHPYLHHKEPERDRLWIAELAQRPVGAIAIHHDDARPGWAKLRWFLVDPAARGQGIGSRLLDTAIGFSREARYDGIFLWTVSGLDDARRVYERAGFQLAHEDDEPCPWAPWAHEQRWELRLGA